MGTGTAPSTTGPRSGTYGRDGLEFARLANLSDAVFAIAMTLLVLGLEAPDVGAERLATELAGAVPQLAAFVLGFLLVANVWWQHHKLLARLAHVDGPLIALDLALLGAVALVPFPTGMLGRHPTALAPVLAFTAVFVVLVLLFLAMVVQAQRSAAWVEPLPATLFAWVVAGYLVVVATMLLAALVAVLWAPLVGIVVLAGSSLPEVLLARRAPPGYRRWS